MKIKYFESHSRRNPKFMDTVETYTHTQALNELLGESISFEEHEQKTLGFFKIMKEQGRITSYEII